MTYRAEFRMHWRVLAAAALGLGSACSLFGYVTSIFGPYLLAEFHWSRAQFSLLGMLALAALIATPITGFLTDMFGVRRVAASGIVLFPLFCVLFSMMNGDIRLFFAIQLAVILLCATTTTTVYCRIVAERFVAARGLALALAASGPALVSAVGSPLLGAYIDAHGWRSGYLVLAAFSLACGIVTLMLLPPTPPRGIVAWVDRRSAAGGYRAMLRNPAFGIIFASAFLCNLSLPLANSQLKVMLLDHHFSTTILSWMISMFGIGVIVGRFAMGVALDRAPTHVVAAIGMGISGIGLLMLAAPIDMVAWVAIGVGLLGICYGAESDVLAYAIVRYFGLTLYSSTLGLLMTALGVASFAGSLLIHATLKATGSYATFMLVTGIAVLAGSANLLRLRRCPIVGDAKDLTPIEQAGRGGVTEPVLQTSAVKSP